MSPFFDRPSILALLPAALLFGAQAADRSTVVIRGVSQDIYMYPSAARSAAHGGILFAPGDGGWRGFAIAIAQTMASWGYSVCGLDTKRYLESFTEGAGLREADVMGDFSLLARWMTGDAKARVILVGWSEGAGLCLLAASGPQSRDTFEGLVTIGLGESNVLGWRWSDNLTFITRKPPKEPTFSSVGFLPKVAPLPLVMIQSSRDEYVALDEAKKLFAFAAEPKRFILVKANDHRFSGNQEQFFRELRRGLEWIERTGP
jgi:fermentation-respiration switch protein FrsA (DUF1100 family)